MATRPLIKESLQVLNFSGLKPSLQNIRTKFLVVIQFAMYIFLFIDTSLQLIFKWEDLNSMDGISALGMVNQILVKMIVMLVNRQIFKRVLFGIGKFWSFDKYGDEIKNEIVNILKLTKKSIKFFLVLFGITVMLYITKPLFSVEKTLPVITYHPIDRNQSPQYEIMYFYQIVSFFWASSALLAFDILFISLILYIVIELKIVKQGFLTINLNEQDERRSLREIRILVDHHNLILRCIKDLDKIYSLMLLSQFYCSLVCICGGLLSLIGGGFPPDLQYLTKYVTFVSTILSQLFIYCSAGGYLILESESVSKSVFESNWWMKTQPEVRRSFALVIQRANKTEKLTAGGMFVLNLESFTSVVRTSLSFFTLVQAVYTRTQHNGN